MSESRAAILLAGQGLIPREAVGDPPLPPLDLTVRPGSIVCLVGPDGAGKSRYLRVLAGLDAPRAGQLTLLGQNAYNLDEDGWRDMRRKIAFLGSRTPLISFFSGWRNLLFPALYHRLDTPEALAEKARGLLDAIGCDGDLEQLPAYLKGVQARKLTIVRALMLDPLLLLLDEPFRPLDSGGARALQGFLVDRARGAGLALVLTTNDLRFVDRHADAVLFRDQDAVHFFPSLAALRQSALPAIRAYLAGTTEEGTGNEEGAAAR